MQQNDPIQKRQGAYLPHWEKDHAIYSVTFRLSDSVPQETLREWLIERDEIIARAADQKRPLTRDERMTLRTLYSDSVERFLQHSHGACWMKREDIASIVAGSLRFFENDRYHLYAWCVMPNHVHVVVRPLGEHSLASILHSWKSFSAKKANALLGRTGAFWQKEYYDHIVRSREELLHAIEYVWENPEQACLQNWQWRWHHEAIFKNLKENSAVEQRIASAFAAETAAHHTPATGVLHSFHHD